MTTVAHLLKSKSDQSIFSIAPTASVFDAVCLMAEKGIGALLVMKDGALVGIVTERDYARKIVVVGRSSRDTPVADIMTTSVMYVHTSHTSEECMVLMTDHRCRHLPVFDDGKVIGVISIGDLVKDIISEQKHIIEQLEHYIHG
jgi:CBS domain-containing protein